jgi:hypothetical protein
MSMAKTSETSHLKNATNFDELIAYITSYGATYNPSRASIQLPALKALSASAKPYLSAVHDVLPVYDSAVAARKVAFAPVGKLITRVNNAIKATETTEQVDESAGTLVRKLQGRRATPKKTAEEKAAALAAGQKIVEISSTHLDFITRADNLDEFTKFLSSVPLYAPNEEELKVTALTALHDDLKAKNTDVVNAEVLVSNARIARNKILYTPLTGLVDIAFDTKTYIKSAFGVTSPEYKQVSKLNFTKPRS